MGPVFPSQNSLRPWISAGRILCCGFFGFGHELSSKCLICAHLRSSAQPGDRISPSAAFVDTRNQRERREFSKQRPNRGASFPGASTPPNGLTQNAGRESLRRSFCAATNPQPVNRSATTVFRVDFVRPTLSSVGIGHGVAPLFGILAQSGARLSDSLLGCPFG